MILIRQCVVDGDIRSNTLLRSSIAWVGDSSLAITVGSLANVTINWWYICRVDLIVIWDVIRYLLVLGRWYCRIQISILCVVRKISCLTSKALITGWNYQVNFANFVFQFLIPYFVQGLSYIQKHLSLWATKRCTCRW